MPVHLLFSLKNGDSVIMGVKKDMPPPVAIFQTNKTNKTGCTHFLLTGDFNYPTIDWENWMTQDENTD